MHVVKACMARIIWSSFVKVQERKRKIKKKEEKSRKGEGGYKSILEGLKCKYEK